MGEPVDGAAVGRFSGRRGLLLFGLAVNLLVVFVLSAEEARACSCVGFTVEEQIQNADTIFSGTVVDLAEGSADLYPPPGPYLGPVTFDVGTTFKGAPGDPAIILGHAPGSSCDNGFQVGESYLVYAYYGGQYGDGPLETNICVGTKPLSEAGADLLALGPPSSYGDAELVAPDGYGSVVGTPTQSGPAVLQYPNEVPAASPNG